MYDRVTELVEVLDRQAAFYLAQLDDRLLIGLPQLLVFLQGDPRLSTIIMELADESRRALVEFESQGREVRSELAELWREARPQIEAARSLPGTDEFDASDDFNGFEAAVARDEEMNTTAFLSRKEPDSDARPANSLLSTFREWTWSAMRAHEQGGQAIPDGLTGLDRRLGQLDEDLTFGYRRFWLDGRGLAGAAHERLSYAASWLNPSPRPAAPEELGEHFSHIYLNRDLLEALYDVGSAPSDKAQQTLTKTAIQVRRDITLLHLQLRSRILMIRSNLGLLKRFAARCEQFDAERLRTLAQKNSKKAEDLLRGELARFLFDHGLNPLLDPPVSGLRPDILDVMAQPVYVEAKQYGPKKERQQFIRGFRQVLDTRGRVSNSFGSVPEVFLIVFRLAGRRIEFPEVVRLPGGVVYMVLADVGETTGVGARQSHQPLIVTEQELLQEGLKQDEGRTSGRFGKVVGKIPLSPSTRPSSKPGRRLPVRLFRPPR